jgi:hypothetical protein
VLDFCGRDGCRVYTVSRSIDSRPRLKPWYCSVQCRELATRPVHWQEPGTDVAACGGLSALDKPHLVTPLRPDVTCQNCTRTSLWRQAEAA